MLGSWQLPFQATATEGIGFIPPEKDDGAEKSGHIARAVRAAQAMFRKRVASKFTHAPFWRAFIYDGVSAFGARQK
jgi:hypothetical protein